MEYELNFKGGSDMTIDKKVLRFLGFSFTVGGMICEFVSSIIKDQKEKILIHEIVVDEVTKQLNK